MIRADNVYTKGQNEDTPHVQTTKVVVQEDQFTLHDQDPVLNIDELTNDYNEIQVPDITIDLECRESSFSSSSDDDRNETALLGQHRKRHRKRQKTFHQLSPVDDTSHDVEFHCGTVSDTHPYISPLCDTTQSLRNINDESRFLLSQSAELESMSVDALIGLAAQTDDSICLTDNLDILSQHDPDSNEYLTQIVPDHHQLLSTAGDQTTHNASLSEEDTSHSLDGCVLDFDPESSCVDLARTLGAADYETDQDDEEKVNYVDDIFNNLAEVSGSLTNPLDVSELGSSTQVILTKSQNSG